MQQILEHTGNCLLPQCLAASHGALSFSFRLFSSKLTQVLSCALSELEECSGDWSSTRVFQVDLFDHKNWRGAVIPLVQLIVIPAIKQQGLSISTFFPHHCCLWEEKAWRPPRHLYVPHWKMVVKNFTLVEHCKVSIVYLNAWGAKWICFYQ